jgi:hypothetical protein
VLITAAVGFIARGPSYTEIPKPHDALEAPAQ